VLHLAELCLNSALTRLTEWSPLLGFRSNQPVSDVDHGLDLQAKIREFGPQAIDVNVEALRIERLVASPNRAPKLFGRDDAIRCPRQA
jgi:hypothetical protein